MYEQVTAYQRKRGYIMNRTITCYMSSPSKKQNEEWKQIRDENGVLLYEGSTLFGKPYGKGKTFWPNGNVYQDGEFNVKGLVKGKEYFPDGKIRFEGTYKINKAYGPNYPLEGKCYNENGELYHEGEIERRGTGVGYPIITKPAEYGPVAQVDKPDIDFFMWEDEERLNKQNN